MHSHIYSHREGVFYNPSCKNISTIFCPPQVTTPITLNNMEQRHASNPSRATISQATRELNVTARNAA
jgi:hypothetical protein